MKQKTIQKQSHRKNIAKTRAACLEVIGSIDLNRDVLRTVLPSNEYLNLYFAWSYLKTMIELSEPNILKANAEAERRVKSAELRFRKVS